MRAAAHHPVSSTRTCAIDSSHAGASRPRARSCFSLLDVSGSMTERDRQLAKTFFFWVAAGLRREYRYLDIAFIAHTTEAWEFNEADFFRVSASGGTVASTGFAKVREVMQQRFNPASCNVYLFYASDGDNADTDRAPARGELEALGQAARYLGYVEISSGAGRGAPTQTYRLFDEIIAAGLRGGQFLLSSPDDIGAAVRHFFSAEAQADTGAARGVS